MQIFDNFDHFELRLAPKGWMMIHFRMEKGDWHIESIYHDVAQRDPFKSNPRSTFRLEV